MLLLCQNIKSNCGGLTMAGYQVPSKASLLLPSTAEQRRENTMKVSCAETGRGRDCSLITAVNKAGKFV